MSSIISSQIVVCSKAGSFGFEAEGHGDCSIKYPLRVR
jgi:hypothetical protein